jgi:hypothetical protein
VSFVHSVGPKASVGPVSDYNFAFYSTSSNAKDEYADGNFVTDGRLDYSHSLTGSASASAVKTSGHGRPRGRPR